MKGHRITGFKVPRKSRNDEKEKREEKDEGGGGKEDYATFCFYIGNFE